MNMIPNYRGPQDDHQARPAAWAHSSAPPFRPLPPLRATLYREDEWRPPLHGSAPPEPFRPLPSAIAPPPAAAPRMDLFAQMAPPRSQRFAQEADEGYDDYPSEATMLSSRAAAAAAKKRSRRMSNSERGKLYRSRRKEYVETLEEQLEEMKRELDQLRLSRASSSSSVTPPPSLDRALVMRENCRASFARTVCEYFSLFQFGVTPLASHSPNGSTTAAPTAAGLTQQQRLPPATQITVLQSLVDPNMRFGEQFGIQMLMEQWERYSTYHSALRFELNSLELVAQEPSLPLILATATLRVRFSRTTIEKVFPHVLWNEELVQRLIGLDVEYPVANRFYFGSDGKIKRYETEVDFTSAFTRALGSSREAMQLVGDALIKEQSLIGPEVEDDEAMATGRSPTGSTSSSHSSSGTVRRAEEPAPQYQRYKQSEPRTTEQVPDDYNSPRHGEIPPGYYHQRSYHHRHESDAYQQSEATYDRRPYRYEDVPRRSATAKHGDFSPRSNERFV